MTNKKKYFLIKIISIFVLLVLMVFSTLIGIANIKFVDGVKIILSHIPFLNKFIDASDINIAQSLIIWKLRMPRIIVSALTGIALAVSGVVYQGIFKNPMADPYILGISSGAALGASIGIVSNIQGGVFKEGIISIFAFVFATLTAYIVFQIASVGKRTPTSTLLLSGMAVSFFISSIITIITVFNRKFMEQLVFWTLGSFSGTNWSQSGIVFFVTFLGYILIKSFYRELDIMSTGDTSARSLGVNVEKTKKILIGISTLMVACCVSVSGIIGFVGLVIPHITRLIFKPSHKIMIPFCAIFGAIFMVLADTIARTLLPQVSTMSAELPVGAVTAAFGAPFFIWLLIKAKRSRV